MDERRSRKRWHSVLKGQIVSDDHPLLIECTVRDLSDTGAKIRLFNTCELPSEFNLEIPSRRLRVQSRVTWSRGSDHGVMFLEKVKAWTDPVRTAAP
ncbi:PilZ domain-containing protein [Microvirga zambiensis]|uniref:PilZ domain-containing protein n=1 Tax=Microvirga zambiensis TaxID=1402137 RepID=UPI00191D14BD